MNGVSVGEEGSACLAYAISLMCRIEGVLFWMAGVVLPRKIGTSSITFQSPFHGFAGMTVSNEDVLAASMIHISEENEEHTELIVVWISMPRVSGSRFNSTKSPPGMKAEESGQTT